MQEKIEWKVEKEDCAGQVRGQQWRESKNTASWSVSQEPHPILSYRRSACSVSSAGVTCARDTSLGFGVPFRHARVLASTLPSFFLCSSLSLYPCLFFFLKYPFFRTTYFCIVLHWLRLLDLRPSPRLTLLAHPKPFLRIGHTTYHIAILSRFLSIMSDALCGPSNALQNFQKHASVDRTLQQDRLTSRQPSSQVSSWEVRM